MHKNIRNWVHDRYSRCRVRTFRDTAHWWNKDHQKKNQSMAFLMVNAVCPVWKMRWTCLDLWQTNATLHPARRTPKFSPNNVREGVIWQSSDKEWGSSLYWLQKKKTVNKLNNTQIQEVIRGFEIPQCLKYHLWWPPGSPGHCCLETIKSGALRRL